MKTTPEQAHSILTAMSEAVAANHTLEDVSIEEISQFAVEFILREVKKLNSFSFSDSTDRIIAEFEEWADTEQFDLVRHDDPSKVYKNVLTRNAWKAFKHRHDSMYCKNKAALHNILCAIPAHNSDSGFVIDRCDCDGNFIGTEYVDPVTIIQNIQQILDDALND
jgi:hypothetical protein